MRQYSAMQREEAKAVISKSDIIILVLSSSALAFGVFRWHENTQNVSAITIPASSTHVVVEPLQDNNTLPLVGAIDNGNTNQGALPADTTTAVTQSTTPSIEPVVSAEPVVESNQGAAVVVTAQNLTESANLGKHQVRSGDYLGKIATQYGTDVQTLQSLNNISGSVIQIGQEILYPL